jgi:hypothetical protein
VLAKTTLDQILLLGDAATAARVAIDYFQRCIGEQGGVICPLPRGKAGWAFSTPHMGYAYRTDGMEAVAAQLGFREGPDPP